MRSGGSTSVLPWAVKSESYAPAPDPANIPPSDGSVIGVLAEMKPMLKWDEATDEEREWWDQLEVDNGEHLSALVLLAVELVRRNATLSDLYRAYSVSQSDSMERLLEVVDELHKLTPAENLETNRLFTEEDRRKAAWRRLKRQRKARRRKQANS